MCPPHQGVRATATDGTGNGLVIFCLLQWLYKYRQDSISGRWRGVVARDANFREMVLSSQSTHQIEQVPSSPATESCLGPVPSRISLPLPPVEVAVHCPMCLRVRPLSSKSPPRRPPDSRLFRALQISFQRIPAPS